MAGPMTDFGAVTRTVFRFARYAGYLTTVLLLLWIVDRLATIYGWGASAHPLLGAGLVAAILGALAWFVGRPAWSFMKMPAAIRPPVLPDEGKRTPKDLVRHLDFLDEYVEAIGANPEWPGQAVQVDDARRAISALRDEASRTKPENLAALSARIAAVEHATIGALLAPLDRKASDAIRAEALAVGISTAVSPNGTLDAFVVLWRNVNLVSRLATIYYGRPGPRGTLRILSEVSTATLVSAYAQDFTEMAGGMIGSVAGKTAGTLAGPLLDGSLNAIGTLRIGYIARARCRSFSAWTPRSRSAAVRGALLESARLAKGLVADLITQVGGGILRLPFKMLGGITNAFMGLFKKPEPEPGEA